MSDRRSEFSAFRLKKETVKFLQDFKQAFELCYGKEMSNDDFIRQALASVEAGDPAVWETYGQILESQQRLEMIAAEAMKKQQNK